MDITIAPMAAEHIEGFHAALDVVARERKYLAHIEAPPLDKVREFVMDNVAKGHSQFVALADGKVVGWCDILPKARPTYAHCGVLGMGLLPAWRGRGNGTALIGATLHHARGRGLVRIELTVNADNAPAIELYERVGFTKEGILRDASLTDGVYRDLILMAMVDRANATRGQQPNG
jgi:RimJ/RimL family protein N-acetyltransferase